MIIGVIVGLFVLGMVGLFALGAYSGFKSSALSNGTAISANDGKSEIRIPSDWSKRTDLNEEAAIQAANPLTEEYLVVISESKVDFVDMTLEKYADLCLDKMKNSMKNPSPPTMENIEIGGRPALQYELTGTIDLVNIGYVVTYVEGENGFHQVIAWTMKSKLASKKQKLKDVVKTFKER